VSLSELFGVLLLALFGIDVGSSAAFALGIRTRYIVIVQGHIGAPLILFALGASMLVFKPKWQARVATGPWSALFCMAAILVLIGFIGLLK
jgi:hypothetical protein